MRKPVSGILRCWVAIGASALLAAMLATGVLLFAADWLRSDTHPRAADMVVVLAGAPERVFYAAELYKAGHARTILVSRPVREHGLRMLDDLGVSFPRAEDVYRQVLERLGVPPEHILIFGRGSSSTYEEAKVLRELLRESRPRLLVVTSPYHIRRAELILRDVVGTAAAEITVVGTPHEPFPSRWWTSQDAARNVLLEIAKITFYRFGGRFESEERSR